MSDNAEIYVKLLDECVDVWRPVRAEHLYGNVYKILGEPDRSIEVWQFEPGEIVLCELIRVYGGEALAATSRLEEETR